MGDSAIFKALPIVIAAGSLGLNAFQFFIARDDKAETTRPSAFFVLANDHRIIELFDETAPDSTTGLAVTPAFEEMRSFAAATDGALDAVLRGEPVASFAAVCNPTQHELNRVTLEIAGISPITYSIAPKVCVYVPLEFVRPPSSGPPRLPRMMKVTYAGGRMLKVSPETPVAWMRSNEVHAMIRHKTQP
jgi:hypothetical protein